VLIGDSITQTLGELGGKYEPLRAVWERHFAPRHAINLGYSGYRTEQDLWDLQDGELNFAVSPKVSILFIGTNNSDDRNLGNASDEAKKNTANINVGYISQNAYLSCASEGLVTGARGSVDRAGLGA
jgi:lysophospholipase L1-like esterase